MDTKKCSKCGEVKSVDEYNKSKGSADGLNYYCKTCCNIIAKAYRERLGTDGIRDIRKRYEANNIDKIKESRKIKYKNNKEKFKAIKKKYYHKHKEKLNKEKAIQYKIRLENDVLFATKEKIRHTIKNSFKRMNFRKSGRTLAILGCDADFFKEYIESKFVEGMTWENYGSVWDFDHIIPICYAMTEEEVLWLNHYVNFQPMFKYINRTDKNSNPFYDIDILNKCIKEWI